MRDNLTLQTAIWIYDIDLHQITWANESALSMWESDSLAELTSRDFVSDASAAVLGALKEYQKTFYAGDSITELWEFSPKGISKKALCRFSGIRTLDNRMAMLVEATPESVFSKHLQSESIVMMATFDLDGCFHSANPPFTQSFGSGKPNLTELLDKPSDFSVLRNATLDKRSHEDDLLLATTSGKSWFRVLFTAVNTGAQSTSLLCQLHNINNRKNRELALAKEVNTDALTGLLNRRGLRSRVSELLQKGENLSLYYVDLDGFKMVNDSIGHGKGDYILKEAARRMESLQVAKSLCCRFGGDEFVFALYQSHLPPTTVADMLVTTLSKPYTDDEGKLFSISASVGVASAPDHSVRVEDLIRFADVAMYHSKLAGKKRWTRFEEGMEIAPQRKIIVSQHLSKAIENNELSLNYQPIIDVQSRTITSFEALLRWYNPSLGQVSPQELINTAESIGLIDEIENWVIAKAIGDLPTLRKYTQSNASISINISSMHIINPHLVEYMLNCLEDNGLGVADLTIEITESTLLDGLDSENNPIQQITNKGISISIDDFGTGYSSLAYLHKINANTVKIDRAFANEATHSQATLKAIQELVTSLGMFALLEGIETSEQAEAAKRSGIDFHQGYFYSKPLPLESFK